MRASYQVDVIIVRTINIDVLALVLAESTSATKSLTIISYLGVSFLNLKYKQMKFTFVLN